MKSKIIVACIALAIPLLMSFKSAGNPAEEMLRYLKQKVFESPEMSYEYTIFHNKGNDTIKGKLSVAPGIVHDVNSQQIIIKTETWLYKVDHNNKTVIVANLAEFRNTPAEHSMVIEKDHALAIADSLILKYGRIDMPINDNKLMKIDISFPKQFYLHSMVISYDKRQEMLQDVYIVSDKLYHVDHETYEEEYIRQTIVCKKFSKKVSRNLAKLDDYFTISNGKIVLRKFKNYKLITINK